jgi:hypothetical protein
VKTTLIGKPFPRIDAYERMSGAAIYPSDVLMPHTLYGAVLRCPHPHALVRKVNTKKAESVPGVRSVLSASTSEADLRWPYARDMDAKLFDPHCRFEGETCYIVHPSDTAPPLVALEASVITHGPDGSRTIPVETFHMPPHKDPQRETIRGQRGRGPHIPGDHRGHRDAPRGKNDRDQDGFS